MSVGRWRYLLIVFALLGMVWAQTSTTSIHGTVSDSKGAVIPKAEVTLANPATGFMRTTATDGQGFYQFVQLPPGTYTVQIAAPGFAATKQRVQLMVESPGTLNVTLGIEKASAVVEVVGEAALVNTENASLGNAFNTQQVMSLPFEGRDPAGILSLQTGVAFVGDNTDPTFDSRNGAVAGARSDQTNITLDGVDNNNQATGYAFESALRAPLDSLQEFRVTTVGSNADTGRSSGGQVALVTRSGTNNIHGALYEYHRPTFTTANDWFNKQSQLNSGLENRPPKVIRNTFGGKVGGPIKKDRAFYFFNYEGQRTRESSVVTRTVPSATLRQGILQYQTCSNAWVSGNPDDPTGCSSRDLSPAPIVLSPANIAAMDPLHIGPNAAILKVLQQYPMPNNDSVGDGLNFRGYTFSAPRPQKLDTYVGKLDFNLTPNGMHRLWIRGNLQNDNTSAVPQWVFADGSTSPPTRIQHWNNKGLAVGYTATLGSNWVNNFRYGIVRPGYSASGVAQGHYVSIRGIDDIEAITRTSAVTFPVHNFVNDTTWVHGAHTIQFGGNLRLLNDQSSNDAGSWFSATTNPSWLFGSGFLGGAVDPVNLEMPSVADVFSNSYNWPMGAVLGTVVQVNAQYNRNKQGEALAEGTPAARHYKSYEMEYYLQDAWRVKPNFTVTAGVRYTLMQPPYEANGVQVQPTNDMSQWFQDRWTNMLAGRSFADPITFDISGQANGKKPYWAWNKLNFAPRFSFAYSPNFENGWLNKLFGSNGKTSIRAGYGLYYDHFGEGIINTFNNRGSFGLSTELTNEGSVLDASTAPRFTGIHNIPTLAMDGTPVLLPAPPGGFPVTFPNTNAVLWGIDDHLKTPYAHVFNVSVTRELKKNMVLEVSYAGRLAHHLLQQDDMAMPLNIVDPVSRMDYFGAAQLLARQVNAGVPIENIAAIPYWEHLFPRAAGANRNLSSRYGWGCTGAQPGVVYTATQNIYDLFACYPANETFALDLLDKSGFPAFATINGVNTRGYQFYSPQFSSLYAWRSIGNSSYHSMLVSLRRRMTNGLQFDVNYTLSKSMDLSSDAERIDEWGGPGGYIENAWNPQGNWGPSDFDARHQINANWAYDLPIGKGKAFGGSWNGLLNGLFGGWSFTGLARWTSGFPFSVNNGAHWATNWQLGGNSVFTGPTPETGQYMVDGNPNMFKFPDMAMDAFRYAMPGESGSRNVLRGPGFFGIDTGVRKTWQVTEAQRLSFSWETFNLTNSVRFDAASVQSSLGAGSFGVYNTTMTKKRVMQFALRYEF